MMALFMRAAQNALPATFLEGYVLKLDKEFLVSIGFQLLNTIILVFVMAWLLYDPVKKFLNDRAERIRKQLEQAEADNTIAKKLRAEYEKRVEGINAERDDLLAQARQRGLERENQMVLEAKREAELIRQSAHRDVELERARVGDEIKRQIVEVSNLVAKKYIADNLDDDRRKKLLDEAMTGLEAVEWHN